MKQKKLRITQEDFILANRKAARMEEIERHGRQIQSRRIVHKSKKTYNRNRLKRAVIKSDDGSFYLYSAIPPLPAVRVALAPVIAGLTGNLRLNTFVLLLNYCNFVQNRLNLHQQNT